MKAIIIGATGATGKELVQQLIITEWIEELVLLVRKKSSIEHSKITEVEINFDKLEDYSNIIQGDLAFSCLGTTMRQAGSMSAQWTVDYDYQYNFASICKKNNIPSFVLLSSVGASSHSKVFYTKMKGQLEDNIKVLGFEKLIIIQPASLIRPQSDRRMEGISIKLMSSINNIGLMKRYRPLHVSQVAKAMINSVLEKEEKLTYISVDEIIELSKHYFHHR